MIIEHLYVENWGPHKKLDLDFDAHIIGIIGGNGKGKSNLLQAISYALTGDLGNTKGTAYIRNYGGKDAADKAIVRLEFRVGQQRGSIERVIKATGTSTRKLDWGGEVYNAAAEVDKRMREILGADKAAMQNAVYIKQGDIDKLVKGTPSERFDTILKLMNLSFVDQRAENVRKSIFSLKAGLKDYTEIWHMLNEQSNQYTNQAREAIQQCAKYEQAHNIVEYLGKLNEQRKQLKYIGGLINDRRVEVAKQKGILNEHIAKYNTLDNLSEVKSEYDSALAVEHERLLKLNDDMHKYQARVTALEELDKAKVALADKLSRKMTLGTEKYWTDICTSLSAHRESVRKYNEARAEYDVMLNSAHSLNEEIANINQQMHTCNEATIRITDEILECTKLQAIGNLCTDSEVCPICGGSMQHVDVQSIKSRNAEYGSKLKTLQEKLEQNTKEKNSLMHQLSVRQSQLEVSNYRIGELQKLEPPDGETDINIISTKLLEASANLREIHELDASIKVLNDSLKTLADQVTDEVPQVGQIQIDTCKQRINDLMVVINKYDQAIKEQKEILTKIEYAESSIEKLDEDYALVSAGLNRICQEAPEGIDPNGSDEYLTEQVAVHRQGEISYAEANSALEIARRSIEDTEKKQEEIQVEIEKNQEKIQLIDDLQTVMTLTSKSGVPLAYANEVFKAITPEVQDMLDMMQANFTVTPDPDRPLTYKFTRVDNTTGYEMPQERLSGGQAIRLSIAILIATQQSILPEVGLLILDEPSSHIDADGVEHMRDMFMGIDSVLENTNMQLICVDHNTVLSTAFDKTIEL